jgi:non-lysosomal glucosylceramidase
MAFSTFWSTGVAWGTYSQVWNAERAAWDVSVRVLYGEASGLRVVGGGMVQVL